MNKERCFRCKNYWCNMSRTICISLGHFDLINTIKQYHLRCVGYTDDTDTYISESLMNVIFDNFNAQLPIKLCIIEKRQNLPCKINVITSCFKYKPLKSKAFFSWRILNLHYRKTWFKIKSTKEKLIHN